MSARDKIFILGISAFIIIAIVSNFFDERDCDPLRKYVDEELFKLKSDYSVNKISIRNGRYGSLLSNLDSLVILDPNELEEIRKLVINREWVPLGGSNIVFDYRLQFTLSDQTRFEVRIMKIIIGKEEKWPISLYGECVQQESMGSQELGEKIETLIERHIKSTNKLNP
jgi:hypothetical protein